MSAQQVHSAEFQVHFLGSSAGLAALKRSMEARGVVSRSRLTPGVTAVVADSTVPLDHPTLVTAREIGIPIYDPAQAIDRLIPPPAAGPRAAVLPVISTPLITIMVLVLVGMLALLGFLGALPSPNPATHTTVQQVSEKR